MGYYENSYRVQEPAVTVTGRGEVGIAVARHYSFTPVVRLLSIKSMHNVDFLANAINCYKVPIESTGVPQLTTVKLQEYKIPMPRAIEEEDAIAKYITTLDAQISASTSRLASLKQIKAASLQAMFPQKGETVPKLRFKGFQGEWEKVRLGDICSKSNSLHSENSLGTNIGKYPIFGASGYLQNISTFDYDVPYIGIIKDGSGVGRSQLYPAFSSLLGTMQYILPKKKNNVNFLAYLFETIDFSLYVNGSSIPHIYFRDYCSKEVHIPQKEEQEIIGRYFTNLDRQITLQSQRLEKLKQIKAACLDKMFV